MRSGAVILLRGINVGGSGRLPMEDLVRILETLGWEDVRTYIQSGNVVARYPDTVSQELGDEIADSILESRGFAPHVLILTEDQLIRAMQANPFPEAESDPKVLHLFFLSTVPEAPDMESIEQSRASSERYELKGRVFYLHAPDGFGRSKLAKNVERYLGVPVTARNWRTVLKLRTMIENE